VKESGGGTTPRKSIGAASPAKTLGKAEKESSAVQNKR